MFWELVTGGGGGADVACGLILGRWELGPASAARVGENDRWSGAVKPIPVLLLGTTCLEQATREVLIGRNGTSSRRKAAHWSADYCSPTASKRSLAAPPPSFENRSSLSSGKKKSFVHLF